MMITFSPNDVTQNHNESPIVMLISWLIFAQFTIPLSKLDPKPIAEQKRDTGNDEVHITTIYKTKSDLSDIKAVKLICINNEILVPIVQHEIKMMKTFQHDHIIKGEFGGMETNIIRIHDEIEYKLNCYQIIMPYYEYDLTSFLNEFYRVFELKIQIQESTEAKSELNILYEAEYLKIMKIVTYRVLKGLEYLHSKGKAHLDVKPENVFIHLIENQMVVVLGDLETMTDQKRLNEPRGTSIYIPPQMKYKYKSYNTKRADLYQLGATLGVLTLELFTKTRFESDTVSKAHQIESFSKLKKDAFRQLPKSFHLMIRLIRRLTRSKWNSLIGYSASDALKDPWLKDVENIDIQLQDYIPNKSAKQIPRGKSL
eukprot:NODE_89_length_21781_cov_0.895836.p1 type:complete len:370 gc:universal NODE_89_length_21781_cov_0.895836:20508-19399(-)